VSVRYDNTQCMRKAQLLAHGASDMSEKRTDGYSDRLRQALREGPNPMSVRRLGEEVLPARFPDLRGATYGGVRQYAAGKVKSPRIELLRAIADVLGVRSDWLAFNDGAMLQDEDAVLRGSKPPGVDLWGAIHDAIPQLRELDISVSMNLVEAAIRLNRVLARAQRSGDESILSLSERCWGVVATTLGAVEDVIGDDRIRRDPEAFSDFASTVILAISGAIHATRFTYGPERRSPLGLLAGEYDNDPATRRDDAED
jgi:transcriptional regulator with XRE-family HTH domain